MVDKWWLVDGYRELPDDDPWTRNPVLNQPAEWNHFRSWTLNILNQVLNLCMTPRPFHCRNPGVPVTFSLKQPRGSAGGLLMRWRVVASHGQNSWLAKLYVVKFSAVCSTHFRYKASFANVVMGPPILFQMVTCAALCCRRRWWW